ncbi:hypothetical protein GOBAR_DD32826 [Gossypium barbadense]|nr:hypothetical protein GOBAR_DD32826 [Gossypium barbadense]
MTGLRLSIADAAELLQVSDGRELVAAVVVGEAAVYVVVVIESQQTAATRTPTFSNVSEVWVETGLINKANKKSLKVSRMRKESTTKETLDAAELLQVSDGRELVAAIVVGEAAVYVVAVIESRSD